MVDQKKPIDQKTAAEQDEKAILAARQSRKYLLNKEMFGKLSKRQAELRRRARRFLINRELLEVNGKPGHGAQLVDLSMNGARLRLPFSPPFLSQITMKFSLLDDAKIFSVVGRVIWSRMSFTRGWYDVGVQFYQNYWEIDQILRLEQR